MSLQVGLLGPLQVHVDGVDVTPRATKDRTLLALLALESASGMPVGRLLEECWPTLPPAAAKHALHVRVASVRKTLGRGADAVHYHANGYRLDATTDEIDHRQFSLLLSRARVQISRRELHAARTTLQKALRLWRGPALSDVGSALTIDAEAHRLGEARVDAVEERIAVDLELGEHREVVGELELLVVAHPLRERFWHQFVIALYRSERSTEAVRAVQAARHQFVDVGLDLPPALGVLETAVLAHDPALRWSPPSPPVALAAPAVSYARADDRVHLAYQVAGDGPIDLVIVPGYVSHLDTWWEAYAGKLVRRLASFTRLILFDKRGTGLSDRPALVGIERWLDDIDTVLEAVDARHPVVLGMSAGGAVAIRWAAERQERCRALIVYAGTPRSAHAPDFPIGADPVALAAFVATTAGRWGTGVDFDRYCPSAADDPDAHASFAAYERKAASPGAAAAYLTATLAMDVRACLPLIQVPTLVVHPEREKLLPVECAHYIADRIPDARLHLLDSADHLIWFSDAIDELADTIERFVNERCLA